MAEESRPVLNPYCDVVVSALAHADRCEPACWYMKGSMLPGGRKSIEPMAAGVHPQDVRSASMHQLVPALRAVAFARAARRLAAEGG
jgi:SRSO17 transposase